MNVQELLNTAMRSGEKYLILLFAIKDNIVAWEL